MRNNIGNHILILFCVSLDDEDKTVNAGMT